MKKWTILATSLLVVGGAAVGVAAADKEAMVAYEPALVLQTTVQEEGTHQVNVGNDQKQLTKEQAITIATDILPGKVKEVELDSDDGRLMYEIEIKYNGNDFDVDVDAITGEVIKIDDNLLNTPIANEMKIGLQEAESIALEQIGDGRIKEIELEKKYGHYVYEAEMKVKGDERDLYIDAMTGDILYMDDHDRQTGNRIQSTTEAITKTNKTERLTPQQAISIAVEHVGGGKVDDLDLEYEKGRLLYEIELEMKNGDDVDVYIDAYSGEVLVVDWD
ncbi:PepSY domain-containing protein [Alkalihalobacillus sp. MEB130]|uniref:PepSY domain-containing protein n=1 Tax=Alkalihalobacillus sp. MEB130 TaxID=2976704 RepID=UPI0028E068E0|nr:PepSY domain-containing protein [Alkalihalobacillus sp. MEB130]MDT8859744.1 PepSY domain-containing protein [Alkalihalobacillus sp. MEB130]